MSSKPRSRPLSTRFKALTFTEQAFIKEQYVRQTEASMGQEKLEKSELEIKFKDYKFFIVETEVKY